MDYVNAFVAQEQPLSLGACVEGVWKGMGRKFGALSLDKREEPPNPP